MTTITDDKLIIPQAETVEKHHFFDAGDIDHLIRRAMFPEYPSHDKMVSIHDGIQWLKNEIHAAELHLTTAWVDRDIATINYFEDYRAICELSIVILKTYLPRPAPQPGVFPPVDIEALKARTDIVAVAEHYTKLHKTGADFTGLCPFHSEKHGSFHVNPARQSWHCFGQCNTGGDVISLIMRAEHTDFKGAVAVLTRQ